MDVEVERLCVVRAVLKRVVEEVNCGCTGPVERLDEKLLIANVGLMATKLDDM